MQKSKSNSNGKVYNIDLQNVGTKVRNSYMQRDNTRFSRKQRLQREIPASLCKCSVGYTNTVNLAEG